MCSWFNAWIAILKNINYNLRPVCQLLVEHNNNFADQGETCVSRRGSMTSLILDNLEAMKSIKKITLEPNGSTTVVKKEKVKKEKDIKPGFKRK